ncbi:hypothetical protein BX661DRAFT_178420 [Kickxella alabastrina]|uniref:uncharacterized protein n=1 Tax=Kickxella alabastrina TaxID=61397 RepID=UPI00221E6558|nr:uncharacterized protein BX661DRAFT_178420 [Kickxella alabastrina]KAI7833457.1 hypothetical protein BX661DRAFT_178420 [Kickxella alabastrina]
MATPNSGSLNFMDDFNATYSFFFGASTLDSMNLAPEVTVSGTGPRAHAAPDIDPHAYSQSHGTGTKGGLPSPVNTDTASKSSSEEEVGAEDSDNRNSTSSDADSTASDTVAQRELEENRRKEEERKAADQRNRRREQMKQQVAFERMKERHRRQFPGQMPAAPNNAVRLQKDIPSSVGIPAHTFSQNSLYSGAAANSYSHTQGGATQTQTINKGHMGAHGGSVPNAVYLNLQSNVSMPNVGYSTEAQIAGGNVPTQFPPTQRSALHHAQQQLPLHVDPTGAASWAVGAHGYPYPGYNSLLHPSQISRGNYQSLPAQSIFVQAQAQTQLPTQQQQQQQQQQQPAMSAHPVKLANIPKSNRNPYLSDSSDEDNGDGASDTTSQHDSDEALSICSSDISYDPASARLVATFQPTESTVLPTAVLMTKSTDGRAQIYHSGPQPLPKHASNASAQAVGNDDLSDTSAGSLPSSKRRVRFRETVSVVINIRNSISEEGLHHDAYDSESSSNTTASIMLRSSLSNSANKVSAKPATLGSGTSAYSQDDAFDDGNGFDHLRYQLPTTLVLCPSADMQWCNDELVAAANSKESSNGSSQNVLPNAARGCRRRLKHRIETHPLRDREAEREQQHQQRMAGAMAKQAPGQRPHLIYKIPQQTPSSRTKRMPAGTDTNVLPSVDLVAEARRALMGHYNVPNPSMPIGNNIPRSKSSSSSIPRPSSVKVAQPPSHAYQMSTLIPEPRQKQKTASSPKSRESPVNNAQIDRSTGKAAGAPSASHPAQVQKSPPKQKAGLESSLKPELRNIMQNIAMASFEATPEKPTVEKLCKSVPETTAHSDSSGRGIEIDTDDIPLSSIARSKSEPVANPPCYSDDRYSTRNIVDGTDLACSYALTGSVDAAATSVSKGSRYLFGRARTTADKKVTARDSFGNSKLDEQMGGVVTRSFSMDGDIRNEIQIQALSTNGSIKRRLGRWGNFF